MWVHRYIGYHRRPCQKLCWSPCRQCPLLSTHLSRQLTSLDTTSLDTPLTPVTWYSPRAFLKSGLTHKLISAKVPVTENSRVNMKPNTHSPERNCKHMLGVKTGTISDIISVPYTKIFLCSLTISIIISKKRTKICEFCMFLAIVFLQNNSMSQCIKYFIKIKIRS